MKFGILYTPIFLEHRPDGYHPENPARLKRAVEGLKKAGLWKNVIEPEAVQEKELLKVHDEEYVELVKELGRSFNYLDPDTYVSPGTFNAALHAFGAVKKAVELAFEDKGLYLALVRPPGHHAGRKGRAFNAPTLGFCIFNNAAYASKLLEGLTGKALVIDFDAHHGNGTQEILWNDPNAVHIDLHERDIYPVSGYEYEVGGKGAEGTKVNIPMPHYSGDDDYIYAWNEVVLPIVAQFKPKVIVISAGFDGFHGDGLTTLRLSEAFYAYAGTTLSKYPLVVVLEGGYSVGLEKGLPVFMAGYLSGERFEVSVRPSFETLSIMERVKEILGEWWEF
ncbi:probable acetylpolyamine aminohydrolase, histon deacetylase family [Thermococcus kodakarensis KOD1]|uniref:Probable acetylpolyamine aminohydrolase, histon deacetylase family n=1 Tax=Thermococcus kodakarensis (strain ATCC BAA-918 / JCM 12380 / KOD1) TaxID=69014 RepID=Q5JFI2_THEKO|nr:histone deacetylase family protein [Thermococcus kodakarensis]WCN28242.1 histone deacetylase family protein [Thermococcus kodakarensis]WCN30537.1 histone deacetylase family protein [Thermococcus kodakarensis]BAD84323.1 probable acetylpolyamine aminohydrolase, histon deacetylase family [Thermococcus kodakarensis KOD1]